MDGSRGFLAMFLGVAAGTVFAWLLLAAAAVAALGSGWDAFVRFGVTTDLEDARHALSQSQVDGDARELQRRLRAVRTEVLEGRRSFGFATWIGHDDVLEDVFEDHVLTADEVSVLSDELALMER